MKKLITLLFLAVTMSASAQTWTQFNAFGLQRKIASGDTTYRALGSGLGNYLYLVSKWKTDQILATKADVNDVVDLYNNQTIDGLKIFNTPPMVYGLTITNTSDEGFANLALNSEVIGALNIELPIEDGKLALTSDFASGTTIGANTSGSAATVSTINGKIVAGSNISIAGSGTAVSPYSISSTGGGGGVGNLQGVTDNGATTTNNITAPAFIGALTGNAATATKLATARTIAGVSFDGTSNISLNNNAITNGAGYITSSALSGYLPLTGGIISDGYVQFKNALGDNVFLMSTSKNVDGGSDNDFNSYVYGNNPYSIWTNLAKRFTIAGNGDANFTHQVTAPTFNGNLNGTAANASAWSNQSYAGDTSPSGEAFMYYDGAAGGWYNASKAGVKTSLTPTLDEVTTKGATTDNEISVGGINVATDAYITGSVYADSATFSGNISAANLPVILSGSASLNFGNISGPSYSILTITVTGASPGDVVSLGLPSTFDTVADVIIPSAYVSAFDTVSIICRNISAATIDVGNHLWKVKIIK